MVRRKGSKKGTLEVAWDIAMNSMTRKIDFNGTETEIFIKTANIEFTDIDREDWWAEAENNFSSVV